MKSGEGAQIADEATVLFYLKQAKGRKCHRPREKFKSRGDEGGQFLGSD